MTTIDYIFDDKTSNISLRKLNRDDILILNDVLIDGLKDKCATDKENVAEKLRDITEKVLQKMK